MLTASVKGAGTTGKADAASRGNAALPFELPEAAQTPAGRALMAEICPRVGQHGGWERYPTRRRPIQGLGAAIIALVRANPTQSAWREWAEALELLSPSLDRFPARDGGQGYHRLGTGHLTEAENVFFEALATLEDADIRGFILERFGALTNPREPYALSAAEAAQLGAWSRASPHPATQKLLELLSKRGPLALRHTLWTAARGRGPDAMDPMAEAGLSSGSTDVFEKPAQRRPAARELPSVPLHPQSDVERERARELRRAGVKDAAAHKLLEGPPNVLQNAARLKRGGFSDEALLAMTPTVEKERQPIFDWMLGLKAAGFHEATILDATPRGDPIHHDANLAALRELKGMGLSDAAALAIHDMRGVPLAWIREQLAAGTPEAVFLERADRAGDPVGVSEAWIEERRATGLNALSLMGHVPLEAKLHSPWIVRPLRLAGFTDAAVDALVNTSDDRVLKRAEDLLKGGLQEATIVELSKVLGQSNELLLDWALELKAEGLSDDAILDKFRDRETARRESFARVDRARESFQQAQLAPPSPSPASSLNAASLRAGRVRRAQGSTPTPSTLSPAPPSTPCAPPPSTPSAPSSVRIRALWAFAPADLHALREALEKKHPKLLSSASESLDRHGLTVLLGDLPQNSEGRGYVRDLLDEVSAPAQPGVAASQQVGMEPTSPPGRPRHA